jgi:uncharacterized protein
MKLLFCAKKIKYDGSQLRPLFAYENFQMSGDSIVSWVGPCDVSLDHMVDYEDKIVKAKIKSDLMLHFIVEYFHSDLFSAVALQRLFASQLMSELEQLIKKRDVLSPAKIRFVRKGDDIFWGKKKLSISIASCSAVSNQIHFAINVVNRGTPVLTCALQDFKVNPQELAKTVMESFCREFEDILFATHKVKPL